MAIVTAFSDFGAQENKIYHCLHVFPFCLPWSGGTRGMIFIFLMLSFKPAFSFPSFILSRSSLVSLQFSSVQSLSRVQLYDPMDCSMLGLPVHHQLLELTLTHVHWVSDAIQRSHPLLSPSPPTFNLYQHQGLFQWVSSSHQMAKILEFQLQHQSFQWTLRTDLL